MQKQKKIWRMLAYASLTVFTSVLLAACGSSSSTPAVPVVPIAPTIAVTDLAGTAVVGAEVFAVPAADVAELSAVPIVLTAGNYDATSLTVDEPLEDLINGNFAATIGVANYISGVTDANGEAVLTGLAVGATDMYFIYVATADAGHLPGGSLSRSTVTGASLDNTVTAVRVSTTPSATATYVGSSACLACHTDYTDQQKTAHKHGIMNTGTPGGLQDMSEYDADNGIFNYMAGVDNFTAGDVTSGGTTVWFYNYDATRGFDKFETSITDPAGVGVTVYATVRAYLEGGVYKMQFTNVINPADPNNLMVREAMMTYGGGVYKQRYLTSFGASESLYMLPLQYQPTGDDANSDRTRKQYRDYHLDYWMAADAVTPANNLFNLLPAASKNFDINCASCHFTGFNVVAGTAVAGEHVASGVADPNGTLHPLSGLRQELNVGCETCHGPGSEHQAAGGTVAIVTPGNLSSERESQICGQCHARSKGNDSFGAHTDATLDLSDQMMKPGTSRAEFLANNTTRNDATTTDFWADGIHSKSHHQQYTDFIKSGKYRNASQLMTCTSCHGTHSPGTDRHQLSGVNDSSLCLSCHTTVAPGAHQEDKTGSSLHASAPAECVECHNVKTAKSGAGESDPLNGGDITSHVFDVPVVSGAPGATMPIPFNNSCGGCHSATIR